MWLANNPELIYTIIISDLAGCCTAGTRREHFCFCNITYHRCRVPDRLLLRGTTASGGSSQSAVRMLDALCRRALKVTSAWRVAKRFMVLLVVGNVEVYSLLGGWLLLLK